MEYQSFVEFDNPTYLPKGDDVASELISIPAEGLKLGDVIQHTVFVSFNIITLGTVVSEVGMDLVVQAGMCLLSFIYTIPKLSNSFRLPQMDTLHLKVSLLHLIAVQVPAPFVYVTMW